ncbi:MAG: M1 family peptidase [Nitrospiraceae bacterium]|nr:M1 family peptidase [Nitrospiraceae bacterium]MSR24861.1 M1 family peptidase [Nitrospiraceae bacterium]
MRGTEADPFRLPRHILPSRYDLRLEPDLAAATFSGDETITVTVSRPTKTIVLNAIELNVMSATIDNGKGVSHRATIALDEPVERCRLTFPSVLPSGTWKLSLSFRGRLNDKLRGFYLSTYKDASGAAHVMAATQFEATDARRAFPCWDEPDCKAVFATTLVIDPALTAVSNTRMVSEKREAGKKILQFADTMRMSTYLVVFVIGEIVATPPTMVGKAPLRLWCVPGKKHLARFGQEIASFSLKFFEKYYGLPYPGDKLDLLAIPDFASGAMENLGAITFRETALLVDQNAATHAELERIADVVAHENAHMWFGDLVTMSWWNGLWLNEAFATFAEMLAVDAWKPEWKRWDTFGASRAVAMMVDGLHSSRPIEYPVRAPKDADAMFDVLTYEKGASVLRMLEQYLGPAVFRDGIRNYLKHHAYGNADTKDLWVSLGRAAKQPVPKLMNGWIFKPGYPLVTVSLGKTGRLHLTQQRFTYLSKATSGAAAGKQRWHIPIQLKVATAGKSESRRVLLSTAGMQVRLPKKAESVLVNEGGHGFYRVRYEPELLDRLLRLAPTGLAPIERFNLVNDAWASALAGLMPLTGYLDMTAHFQADRDKNVWAVLIESFHLLHRIVEPGHRPALEAFVRDRIRPVVAELGWMPRAGEDELRRQLRGELLRALGTIGNDRAAQTKAAELHADHAKNPAAVDPNLLPALIAILAHSGDETRYLEFAGRFQAAATPQEERRYLYALAAFKPVDLLARTLAKTINGEFRTQDAPFMVRLLLMSVYGREAAWAFVKTNWETMDRLYPKQGLRRMCEGVIGLAMPAFERDVRKFFRERKIDLGGKSLAQYLEELRIAVAFRERAGKALGRYLNGDR